MTPPPRDTNSHAIEVLAERIRHACDLHARLEKDIERRFVEVERATDLAAKNALRELEARAVVIEKRLADLNHEAQRLNTFANQTVLQDVWKQSEKSRDEWQRVVERELATLREARSSEHGKDAASSEARELAQQVVDGNKATQRWLVGVVISVLVGIAAMLFRAFI